MSNIEKIRELQEHKLQFLQSLNSIKEVSGQLLQQICEDRNAEVVMKDFHPVGQRWIVFLLAPQNCSGGIWAACKEAGIDLHSVHCSESYRDVLEEIHKYQDKKIPW